MNFKELTDRINSIEREVQRRAETYLIDSGYTNIIDNQLNGYLRGIKTYCRNNNLLSYLDEIDELLPVDCNAVEFFCFWDSIKDSMQVSQKVFSGIDRLKLIQRIASKLQQELTRSQIDIYLNGFGIVIDTETVVDSKRLYVEGILGNTDGVVVLKIAEDLGLASSGVVQVEIADKLSDEFIQDQIQKCHIKINTGDFDGAITNARTLIESILLSIEEKILGTKGQNDGKLESLYKRVSKLLNMYPEDPKVQNNINQILRGFLSIINGFSGISNNMADRHATGKRPQRHHAILAVNSALTICNFLMDSFHYQKAQQTK